MRMARIRDRGAAAWAVDNGQDWAIVESPFATDRVLTGEVVPKSQATLLAPVVPRVVLGPALVLRVAPSGAKVAYLGADLDRVAGGESRPDHLRLLGNLVGWQLGDERVLRVVAPRGVECSLYRQGERGVLHLVHTDAPSQIPGTLDELVAVGPIQVDLAWAGTAALSAHALVSDVDLELDVDADAGRVRFTVPVVEDHEIIVIGPGEP